MQQQRLLFLTGNLLQLVVSHSCAHVGICWLDLQRLLLLPPCCSGSAEPVRKLQRLHVELVLFLQQHSSQPIAALQQQGWRRVQLHFERIQSVDCQCCRRSCAGQRAHDWRDDCQRRRGSCCRALQLLLLLLEVCWGSSRYARLLLQQVTHRVALQQQGGETLVDDSALCRLLLLLLQLVMLHVEACCCGLHVDSRRLQAQLRVVGAGKGHRCHCAAHAEQTAAGISGSTGLCS
jgi:hypothetical protein